MRISFKIDFSGKHMTRLYGIVYAAYLLVASLDLHAFTKVYVTSSGSEITVLNANNSSFVKNFTPSFGETTAIILEGVVGSPDGLTAYAADSSAKGIWIIDSINDVATAFVPISGSTYLLQIDVLPDGSKVYVTDRDGGIVWVMLTTDNSVSSLSHGATKPSGLALNPSGSNLYVSDTGFSQPHNIYVYNTSNDSLLTTIEGTSSNFIAVNSSGIGYNPNSSSTDIAVFDTKTNTSSGTITTLGSHLDGVAFTSDGKTAYVASNGDSTLQVIIDGVVKTPISLTGEPWQVAVNPTDNAQVYCTTNPYSTVLEIYAGAQVSNADFDAHMTNATYLAYVNYTKPTPPRSLAGKVINNRFLSQTDIIHQLTWEASTSPNVTCYTLSRNGKQIAIILAQKPLKYDDHNRARNVVDFYEVRAINGENEQSNPASIFIP